MLLKQNKRKGFTRRKKDVEVPNMEGNYYGNKRKKPARKHK